MSSEQYEIKAEVSIILTLSPKAFRRVHRAVELYALTSDTEGAWEVVDKANIALGRMEIEQ